jgi:Spy/CpxP family protein refolding chaperone
MKKAKLAFAALFLSCILTNPAARAADDSTTPPRTDSAAVQDKVTDSDPGINRDAPANVPVASQAQEALGGMMQLGEILLGDIPRPGQATSTSQLSQSREEEQVALGSAPDDPLTAEGHTGMGSAEASTTELGKPPVMAMKGCPMMMRFHHGCPLSALDGPNALTDDQCQKLYEIKGQFIATIVPKGLNMYVLIRKMGDLLTAADPDMKAVKETERQISSATSDLSTTVVDSLVSVDQILTPAQRQELHRRLVRAAVGAGGHPHHDEPHADK